MRGILYHIGVNLNFSGFIIIFNALDAKGEIKIIFNQFGKLRRIWIKHSMCIL